MHESSFFVGAQAGRKDRLVFYIINRKEGKKIMVNQIFVEGIISRRKSGAMEIQDIDGISIAKLTLKSFTESNGQWETYGVIAEGPLASTIANMNLTIGMPVFVTGSVYQTCYTNPITEETMLYFVINATAIRPLGAMPEKQKDETLLDSRQQEGKISMPQPAPQLTSPKVRDAKANELPFPVSN